MVLIVVTRTVHYCVTRLVRSHRQRSYSSSAIAGTSTRYCNTWSQVGASFQQQMRSDNMTCVNLPSTVDPANVILWICVQPGR
jgi:hypothetical protein